MTTTMRKAATLMLCLLLTAGLFTCAGGLNAGAAAAGDEVIVLYTNDVHTYIDNKETDDSGEEHPLLNYASVAALKNELIAEGKNVLLVDDGDFSQGSAYGAMDEGASVIQLMNAAGYDLATLGNHEFDYGQARAFEIIDEAEFPIVSCNFYNVSDGSTVLAPYEILQAGDVKIAFIGISTPETITKSTPVYFQDENGEYIYNFYGSGGAEELYSAVQAAIDEVEGQADYIIALGHLGVDLSSAPCTSELVIQNTTGLDAFIDGHSHTVMEEQIVQDKAGNDVVLTQTGSYLAAIGQMTIDNGTIHTHLITEYDAYDETVSELTAAWVNTVNDELGVQIAELASPLYMTDPDTGVRIARNHETNSGDFIADSIYYYLNERAGLSCDAAIINGGGIRSDIDAGEYTYLSSKSVNPFGNVICLVEMTGQQLLDTLEKGAMYLGETDPDTGNAAENGGFMHVAGITYTIDTRIPSTVQTDDADLWVSGPSGEYRVRDVMIYNRETGEFEPLDTEKTYTVGSYNYLLRNQGCGLTFLSDLNVVQDYILEDYLVLSEYAKDFAAGEDGIPVISSTGSPLAAYENYPIDYESLYGAGRIQILSESQS